MFLFEKFLIFKFPFNELEHFWSSLSSSSEKLSFRVQVRVRQNEIFFWSLQLCSLILCALNFMPTADRIESVKICRFLGEGRVSWVRG